MSAPPPLCVLIAALGGEGGGLLTDWLVRAAELAGLAVQSTSIPGVAQRTGATTYYLEIAPEPTGRRPLFALYPCPGEVDLVVATELVEAGRAIGHGFVDPERTTLIAATHRVFAIEEKAAMADGRFEAAPVLEAAGALARRALLFDPTRDERLRRLPLNAVLLGAIAASAELPIAPERFREAIRDSGVAVAANLQAFEAGLGIDEAAPEPAAAPKPADAPDEFPEEAARVVALAVARLADYQDAAYGELYLGRLRRLRDAGADAGVLAEAGRQLALWMAYEDVIRVADLKSRPERLARLRAELAAGADQPVHVVEFFKPGVEELAALLPPRLGRALRGWAERRGLLDRLQLSMHLRSTTLLGRLRLRLLARLRPWRPRSFRFALEQARIEAWVEALLRAAGRDGALALEIARLPRLLKGYGLTQRRGLAAFEAVMERAVAPALAGRADAGLVRRAREAALADPEGGALAAVLAAGPQGAAERLAAE